MAETRVRDDATSSAGIFGRQAIPVIDDKSVEDSGVLPAEQQLNLRVKHRVTLSVELPTGDLETPPVVSIKADKLATSMTTCLVMPILQCICARVIKSECRRLVVQTSLTQSGSGIIGQDRSPRKSAAMLTSRADLSEVAQATNTP